MAPKYQSKGIEPDLNGTSFYSRRKSLFQIRCLFHRQKSFACEKTKIYAPRFIGVARIAGYVAVLTTKKEFLLPAVGNVCGGFTTIFFVLIGAGFLIGFYLKLQVIKKDPAQSPYKHLVPELDRKTWDKQAKILFASKNRFMRILFAIMCFLIVVGASGVAITPVLAQRLIC